MLSLREKKRKATETQTKLHTFAKGSHNESKVKENDQSEIQKKANILKVRNMIITNR